MAAQCCSIWYSEALATYWRLRRRNRFFSSASGGVLLSVSTFNR